MTYVVPEELKAMLDVDAGKQHSASGAVVTSLARILERHEQMVRDQVRREAETQGPAPIVDVPGLMHDLENARLRLAYARRALVDDGYFTEGEVSDDIAPRIMELARHLRGRIDAGLPAALLEALDQLRNQVALHARELRQDEPCD